MEIYEANLGSRPKAGIPPAPVCQLATSDLFLYPYYHERHYWGGYQFGTLNAYITPDPSTIGFLGLGGLVVLGYKKNRSDKGV